MFLLSGCASDDGASLAPRATTAPGATAGPRGSEPLGTVPPDPVGSTAAPDTAAATTVPPPVPGTSSSPRPTDTTLDRSPPPATTRTTTTRSPLRAGSANALDELNRAEAAFRKVTPKPGAAAVGGRVIDGHTNEPVDGARVWMINSVDSTLEGSTVTTSDGRYHFASMVPGHYHVSVQDPAGGRVSVFVPFGPDFRSGQDFSIGPGLTTIDATLFAVADQPVPPYAGTATGRRIAVYGDSLVQQGTTAIRDAIEPLGVASVRGISMQRLDQMLPIAAKEAFAGPTTVVIALGNNDVTQSWPIDQSITALRTQAALFPGATCIAVLNVNDHTADAGFNARAHDLDVQLAAAVATIPHGYLVDWEARAAELLAGGAAASWFTDGVHLTPAGSAQYGRLMADAISACDPR